MKKISLTQGKFAIVDDDDYEQLSRWKWYALKRRETFYAVRKYKRKTMIFMHRQILQLTKGDSKETDHRNHCGLDNRKQNIRICSKSQNHQNQRPRKLGMSKYKGVVWHKKKWQVQIGHRGKEIYLGRFDNEIEAAKAYDHKAKELFGEFVYTNF